MDFGTSLEQGPVWSATQHVVFWYGCTYPGTVLLGLITQWLNPLREFLAPSFSPQLESAAPLLALQLY